MFELFRLAARNIRHRRKRSWLTILGTLVGILAIVALLSIGQGLQNSVQKEFQQLGGDKVFIRPGGASPVSQFVSSNAVLDDDDLEVIRNTRGVEEAAGVIQTSKRARYGEESKYVTLVGVPTDESFRLVKETQNFVPTEGRFLRRTDSYNIAISEALARETFDRDVSLRSQITINGTEFRVVGLVEATGNIGKMVLMNQETMRDLTGKKGYDQLAARISPGYTPAEVEENIKQNLRNHRNLQKGEEDFTTNTASDIIDSFQSQLSLIRGFLVGLGAISLFVGAVGIMNTMYTSVTERTQEIGVMKAVGATRRQILSVFLIESGMIGVMGGLLGILGGLGISYAASGVISQQVGINMTPGTGPGLIIGALLFAFLVGTVSGYFPARNAAEKNPVEALRYEK